MPAVQLNKNGYFFICLIGLVLLILWTSRTDLPPKKDDTFGFVAKKKPSEPAVDFGGLGGGNAASPPPAAPPAQVVEAAPAFPPGPDARQSPPHDSSPPAVDPNAPQVPPSPENPAEIGNPANPYVHPSSQYAEPESSAPVDLHFYTNPQFDILKLKSYTPHNYRGPGHETFATYLSTRVHSMQDPYFLAAQQLVYRVLWDPRSKSAKHPITVFVAPHIAEEQRDILIAAGALVRELDFVEGHMVFSEETKWRDLFSKLNMWAETDFTRIAFLDLDAFPIQNIDGIFDAAKKQRCEVALIAPEEQANVNHICEYVFSGTDAGTGSANAGVMVFEPNTAMHQYLLRESKKTDNFDNNMAEQPFLNWAFRANGPFPTHFIDRSWNGIRPQESEKHSLKVVHAKLWAINPAAGGGLSWASRYWSQNWLDMLALYEKPAAFESMRAADGMRAQRRRR